MNDLSNRIAEPFNKDFSSVQLAHAETKVWQLNAGFTKTALAPKQSLVDPEILVVQHDVDREAEIKKALQMFDFIGKTYHSEFHGVSAFHKAISRANLIALEKDFQAGAIAGIPELDFSNMQDGIRSVRGFVRLLETALAMKQLYPDTHNLSASSVQNILTRDEFENFLSRHLLNYQEQTGMLFHCRTVFR